MRVNREAFVSGVVGGALVVAVVAYRYRSVLRSAQRVTSNETVQSLLRLF